MVRFAGRQSEDERYANVGLLKSCYVTRRPLCVLEGNADCTVISQIPVNSNLAPHKQKDFESMSQRACEQWCANPEWKRINPRTVLRRAL